MTRPPQVTWNAADYASNSGAQLAWARELIACLALQGHERLLDVGCGDGKVTADLSHALPQGRITGVDSSDEMLAFARASFPAAQYPNLDFVRSDARELRFPSEFDIVFSNATLHWVDDHPAFLRGVAQALKPGGRLVTSCGGQGNAHDVFVALRATLRQPRWRQYFRKLTAPYFFYRPADYEKWLPQAGFEPQVVRLVNKEAVFPGGRGLVAWLRTTWLPYTQRVPEAQRETFIAAVVERYLAQHPLNAAGELTVRMVRLEIEAVKLPVPHAP